MAQRKRMPGWKRRMAGWMLLTLGVLVAAVWAASGWGAFEWVPDRRRIFLVDQGHVAYDVHANNFFGMNGWWLRPHPQGQRNWFWFYAPGDFQHWTVTLDLGVFKRATLLLAPAVRVDLALWPIPLLLWTPAALLLRSGIVARRRAREGKCKACGYDLAGLPPAADARCPECGKQQASHG